MSEQEFYKLIDNDKYQVFIVLSRGNFPVNFAVHPWVVVNNKGDIKRYEIKKKKNNDKNHSHFYINSQPPFQGLPFLEFINKFFQPTKLIKFIEGDENSLAKKMADVIGDSENVYPYTNVYGLTGPNCGTYVEWILDQFPEIDVKLPWNSVGKNFKIKKSA